MRDITVLRVVALGLWAGSATLVHGQTHAPPALVLPGSGLEAALETTAPEAASLTDAGDPAVSAVASPAAGLAPDPFADASPLAPTLSLRPVLRDTWAMPVARWDDHPNGARWTVAVMGALRAHGAPLLDVVPGDIAEWCPAYPTADAGQRAAFWTGLMSMLAWHESTHRPRAVGGGGRWFGLVQIAPSTARWRNCAVGSGEALLDGAANLRCGVRIAAITVPRDGVIAEGMRGVAADWGPFHSRRKREDMRNWVRGQDYCRIPILRRPEPRPGAAMAALAAMAGPRSVSGPLAGSIMTPVARPAGLRGAGADAGSGADPGQMVSASVPQGAPDRGPAPAGARPSGGASTAPPPAQDRDAATARSRD